MIFVKFLRMKTEFMHFCHSYDEYSAITCDCVAAHVGSAGYELGGTVKQSVNNRQHAQLEKAILPVEFPFVGASDPSLNLLF